MYMYVCMYTYILFRAVRDIDVSVGRSLCLFAQLARMQNKQMSDRNSSRYQLCAIA